MATGISFNLFYQSPIGWMCIEGNPDGISAISFVESVAENSPNSPACLIECRNQLMEYFAGERKVFDLQIIPAGTGFQRQVWQELEKIPFGKTRSYMDIALALENEKAIRAVGAANGKNPVSVVVPCHRVIGSNGKLTGYAGGIWRKKWLLEHEERLRGEGQTRLF